MTLNADSWFLKYYVYLNQTIGIGDGMPQQTNLCAFFWKVMLGAPIFLILAIVIAPFAAFGVGLAWCWKRTIGHIPGLPRVKFLDTAADLVCDYIIAKKHKYCPIIRLRNANQTGSL